MEGVDCGLRVEGLLEVQIECRKNYTAACIAQGPILAQALFKAATHAI